MLCKFVEVKSCVAKKWEKIKHTKYLKTLRIKIKQFRKFYSKLVSKTCTKNFHFLSIYFFILYKFLTQLLNFERQSFPHK